MTMQGQTPSPTTSIKSIDWFNQQSPMAHQSSAPSFLRTSTMTTFMNWRESPKPYKTKASMSRTYNLTASSSFACWMTTKSSTSSEWRESRQRALSATLPQMIQMDTIMDIESEEGKGVSSQMEIDAPSDNQVALDEEGDVMMADLPAAQTDVEMSGV